MLGCFAGSASQEFATLAYVVVGTWIGTLAFGGVNFALICANGEARFKKVHLGWFAGYAVAMGGLLLGWLDLGVVFALVLGVGIPIAVGVHFVALLMGRRKFARAERRSPFEV